MFFVQKCKILTQGSLTFLEKRLELCIYCNFLKNFLKFSNILRRPGGCAPADPLLGRPPKNVPPPNRNPGGAAAGYILKIMSITNWDWYGILLMRNTFSYTGPLAPLGIFRGGAMSTKGENVRGVAAWGGVRGRRHPDAGELFKKALKNPCKIYNF